MSEIAEKLETGVGEMHKRREIMEDGRRYIIYYTFGGREEPTKGGTLNEEKENV